MNVNIKCLVEACKELQIPYRFIDDNHNVVEITRNNQPSYFLNTTTPFNREDMGLICKDKYFCYKVLKDTISTPKTLSFLDPNVNEIYQEYLKFNSYEEILKEIQTQLPAFPLIIKRNRGSQGNNVFLCHNADEVLIALQTIFDKASRHYDYVALAQEYINIQHEYRVIWFKGKVVLCYEKSKENASFDGNLSPLHWEGARAILIQEQAFMTRLEKFLAPIEQIGLNYTGADIVIDGSDQMHLIELNSKPQFNYFVKDNGEKVLVEMFKEILEG